LESDNIIKREDNNDNRFFNTSQECICISYFGICGVGQGFKILVLAVEETVREEVRECTAGENHNLITH
jgi:hypothetical protein